MRAELPPGIRAAAEAATGFMPPAEGLALYEAAAGYAGPGPVLEVGTYCGKSTIYLAAAARAGRASWWSPWTTTAARRSTSPAGSTTTRRWSTRRPAGWTRCRGCAPRWPRPGSRTTSSSWWAGPPRWPRLWRTPLGMVFIDGGHTDAAAVADYEGWAPWVAPGGVLAIHDVFPDPADGGQAPYRIYQRALKSGAFTEVPGEGSLRLLERTGDGIG